MSRATFRNPRGVAAVLILGAAMWTCLCLVLVMALTACGPVIETVSPARIVCADNVTGAVMFDYTVDSATLANGAIQTITIGADTAPFGAPAGAECEIRP